MSLRAWLPLNGNLNNQGLDEITVTNTGATVDNSGKIGQCYSFSRTQLNFSKTFTLSIVDGCAISAWVYISTAASTCCILSNNSGGPVNFAVGLSDTNKLWVYHYNAAWYSKYSTGTITLNTWNHVAYVIKDSIVTFYINGQESGTATCTISSGYSGKIPMNSIGGWSSNYNFNGKLNDIRIYDHALSPKEVKEISKGLVLHYPLNRVNKNLFKYTGLNEFNQELQLNNYNNTGSFTQFGNCLTIDPANYIGTYFTISLDAISPNGTTSLLIYNANGNPRYFYYSTTLTSSLGNKWEHFSYTFQNTDRGSSYSAGTHPLEVYMPNQMGGKIRNVKIEIGTAETPWTPYTQVDMDTTVYDCSGYKYNGIPIGNLTINSDTPRYDCSISLSGSEQAIQIPNLSILLSDGQFTISVWFRKNTGEWSSLAWETLIGGPSGFELETKNGSSNSPVYYAYSWGAGNVSYTLDTWHLATMTRTSNGTLFYLDGVQKFTGTAGSIPSGNYYIGSWKDSSHQNMRGSVSDFRLYATALSDTDIKELYETGQSIDNKGNIYAYEFKEE